MVARTFARRIFAGAAAILLCLAPPARAGGGPENLFLVVNAGSWASQSVANHYVELRKIPPINVLYLNWHGGFESVDGETFRQQILRPTIEDIEARGLGAQIDYIIYSSDFPYSVDLGRDFAGTRMIEQMRPACSINSATYLRNFVFGKNPAVMDFRVNRYMRTATKRTVDVPTRAFHSWYGWGDRGELIEAGGHPYMLSTMLAMTSGRGNSVREVVDYLRRSAAADGTHPKGTIYFSTTDDVRTKTRAGQFEAAVAELKKLGVAASIISTPMPSGRNDVMGLTSGVADFSWQRTGSTILPGAICENLTSFGGIMTEAGGQTPLAEFLRYGAAGSCGTVIEPGAMEVKFPSAQVHVHYARGCTLAEAFYQSVFAPAQLLIVGDPLCRPWADIPKVEVDGVGADGKVSGKLVLTPKATWTRGGKTDHFELFVDGRRMGSTRASATLEWDSAADGDGYHELRVVAIGTGPIETQGRAIIPITVDNRHNSVQLSTTPAGSVRWGEKLTANLAAPGMKEVLLIHNARVLGKVDGERGDVEIDPRQFGTGPLILQAVGTKGMQATDRAWAAPVKITIEPPRPLPALANPPKNLGRGLVVQSADGKVLRVDETRDPAWLTLKGVRGDEPFVMQGFFEVDAEDMYQFQVWHYGGLKVSVDGHGLYSTEKGDNTQRFIPVALAAGMHRLTVSGKTAQDAKLRILFGGPGAVSLSRDRFFHAR